MSPAQFAAVVGEAVDVHVFARKKLEITGISIHRVVDGKLVEHRANADLFSFMEQLGALPTPVAAAAQ